MLYTRIYNKTATRRFLPYIPPVGVWLEPGEAVAVTENIWETLAAAATQTARNKLAAFEDDIISERVLVVDPITATSGSRPGITLYRQFRDQIATSELVTAAKSGLSWNNAVEGVSVPETGRFLKTVPHGLSSPRLVLFLQHEQVQPSEVLLIASDYRQTARLAARGPATGFAYGQANTPEMSPAQPTQTPPLSAFQANPSYAELSDWGGLSGVFYYAMLSSYLGQVLQTRDAYLEGAWIDGANLVFAFQKIGPSTISQFSNAPSFQVAKLI